MSEQKSKTPKYPDIIGKENICSNIHLAVDRATVLSEKMGEERPRKHKPF
jgi:hypothetical protein